MVSRCQAVNAIAPISLSPSQERGPWPITRIRGKELGPETRGRGSWLQGVRAACAGVQRGVHGGPSSGPGFVYSRQFWQHEFDARTRALKANYSVPQMTLHQPHKHSSKHRSEDTHKKNYLCAGRGKIKFNSKVWQQRAITLDKTLLEAMDV